MSLWLASLCLVAACAPAPPPLDTAAIRATARRAIVEVRGANPQTARRIEGLLTRAEAASAAFTAAPFWRKDPQAVSLAWNRLAVEAGTALESERRRSAADRARWLAAAAEARPLVAAARQDLSDPGMGRREAEKLHRAEAKLDLAGRLAAERRISLAADAAEQAVDLAHEVAAAHRAIYSRFEDPALRAQWRRWVVATIRESQDSGGAALVVDKLRRRLDLYWNGVRLRSFEVELGTNGLRPKVRAGDQATPEGRYRIVEIKQEPKTLYHKALLINYPNDSDVARWRREHRRGLIPARMGTGGLIEIHGGGGQGRDWTNGCVAMTNEAIDRLFGRVRVGTPVTIVGTDSHAG